MRGSITVDTDLSLTSMRPKEAQEFVRRVQRLRDGEPLAEECVLETTLRRPK